MPWELRVLAVRLQGMGFNDARRGVMGYFDLARDARISLSNLKMDREGNEGEIKMWEQRLEDLGIRVASALVEMEDLDGAARFLQTLKPSSPAHSQLEMKKALLWLCMGDVDTARSCLRDGDGREKNTILALAYMADNEFENSVKLWNDMLSSPRSEDNAGERAMWRQNLGVCLLYLGRMDEVFIPPVFSSRQFPPSLFLVNFPLLTRIAPQARTILEELVDEGNGFHALTFNLSTIYELCTERSRPLKIGLAEKVAELQRERDRAGEGEGEGGKGSMEVGWEKVNADFKL